MKSCDQVRSELLEHLYDLVEGEDGHALANHLNQCVHCQAELGRAREQMALIAEAAKEEFPNVRFIPPTQKALEILKTSEVFAARRRWGIRGVVAAAILLAVAGLGIPMAVYWRQQAQVSSAENALQQAKDRLARADTHRVRILDKAGQLKTDFQRQVEQADQQAIVARNDLVELGQDVLQKIQQTNSQVHAKQMDLTVVGPRVLEPGASNSFQIQTRSFRLQPMPARITVAVRDQNRRELFKKEAVPSRGDLIVTLPRDLPLKPDAALTLEVQARAEQDQHVVLSETLPLTGSLYVTHMATDKPMYQPGETVRFRSLTLERFGLRPPSDDLELIYKIAKPTGEQTQILKCISQPGLAAARRAAGEEEPILGPDQKPIRGVGAGEYVIDLNAPAGQYTLTVSETHQRFPSQERKFLVARSEKLRSKDTNLPPLPPRPASVKKWIVEFFPEGGDLVAGVPNRIYFQALTASNQPVVLKGRIVDDSGITVTALETFRDPSHPEASQGLGMFTFTPRAGKEYQLKIDPPAESEGKFVLPAAKRDGVVFSTPGVTADNGPIKAWIRSVGADRSLLIGAYCRGQPMSQQSVDVKNGEVKEVELGPESGVGGVYRVTVFERVPDQARGERLEPRAERLIYRPPAGRLRLTLQPDKPSYQPGDRARVRITASNENNRPQPAIALVAVVDQSVLKLANEKTYRSMLAHFLLTTEVRRPEDLEYADFLLSAEPQAATALDLLLGAQGWRRFAEQDPEKFQKEHQEEALRLLALEGQLPARSMSYGQEAVQKVVKEFHNRYADLEKHLTKAEEKQVLARKGTAQEEKLQRLREEAKEEETERIAAVSRVMDAQESFAAAAGKFQNYQDLFGGVILPVTLIVFLLAAVVNLILAVVRSKQSRPIPYLAGAACSLLLVALALTQRAILRDGLTIDKGIEIADLGRIEIEGPIAWIPPAPAKQPEKGVQPERRMIAPVIVPQPRDQKENVPNRGRQGAVKDVNQTMPPIPLHPAPAKENQPQTAGPQTAAKTDRANLLPRLPMPPQAPPPFIVREYAHLRPQGKVSPDFAETLYCHPVLILPNGTAEISFELSDPVTIYQILVAAHTPDGRLAEEVITIPVKSLTGH